MEIASAAGPNGSFTPTRLEPDQACPGNVISIIASGPEYAPAPENIQLMQIAGRAWSEKIPDNGHASTLFRTAPSAQRVHSAITIPAQIPISGPVQHPLNTPLSPSFRPYRQMQSLHRACTQLSFQISSANRGSSEEHQKKYANALHAINRLIKAISNHAEHVSRENTHTTSAGGIIAVDLDEAIHGLYTAISYTNKATANGFSAICESLTEEANLWAHDPMAWLAQSAMPRGVTDISIAAIVTIALVPFALLALHAGIGEMRAAKQNGKILDKELLHSRTFLQTLQQILASSKSDKTNAMPLSPQIRHMVDATSRICAQQLDDLTRAQQKNRENGQIGAFSALSGGAIALKATLDVTGKIGYLAMSNTGGAILATSVGVAGSVLAPIAAVSAVGLGARMVLKSNEALKNFTTVCARLKKRLNTSLPLLPLKGPQLEANEYLQFLPKKLDQRSRFFKTYAEKNRRFLFGSLLYAASTLTSAALTCAALMGFGIALGPIGLGILVAVGITGGLLMGRYSTQFLFGHARQHRYEGYSVGDDPELDRHFLGTIEAFTKNDPRIAKTTGIKMRAAFYEQASRREELRQDFLSDVANDLGKRYDDMVSYSTDSKAVRQKRHGIPGKWKTMSIFIFKKYESVTGYAQAGKCYLATLLQTRHHNMAKTAAGQLRHDTKPYLNVTSLQNWLEQRKNYPAQIKLMQSSLSAQSDYLQTKTTTRLKMYTLSSDIESQAQIPAQTNATHTATAIDSSIGAGHAKIGTQDCATALDSLLDQLAAPLIRDVRMLDQTKILQSQLRSCELDSPELANEETIAALTSRFLALQCGHPYDPAANTSNIQQSQSDLANYYLKEARGRHRNLRGLLVDAELQATRLTQHDLSNAA